MKIVCCAAFLLLGAHFSTAQTVSADSCEHDFEGFVQDISSRQPVPFATIQIKGRQEGVVADENGYFAFRNLCEEEFDVVISSVGYKQATHHHDAYHAKPKILLAPDSITLESVVIEGEAVAGDLLSGTVESLSARSMEQQRGGTLGDLAGSIAGVSVLSTGQNVVKPVIHGLHSNRILIINNGVRHEFQSWGDEHAPEIDASMIDNISVIKGAATVRYGPEALGGVLLINAPAMELLTPWQGEAGLSGASNGRSAEGSFRLQKGYRRLALLGQAAYTRQGDLHTPDYVLTNTSKAEGSLALGARYHLAAWDFNLYYNHFQQNLGILRGSVTGSLSDLVNAIESKQPLLTRDFSYAIQNPRQAVQHDMLKLNTRWSGKNQSVEMQYAYQLNQRQEYDVRRGTNNERPSIDLILATQTLDVHWKHPDVSGWTGSMGIQGLYQANSNQPGTNTVPFVPNFNNSRLGIFMIERKALGASQLEWGLRYDYQYSSIRGREPNNDIYRNTLNFQNVTATVGYVREIGEGHIFRTNIGTAWRPPNISELYSFGKHQASFQYGLWRYVLQDDNSISVGDILTQDEKPAPSEMGLKWIGTYEMNQERRQSEITAYVNYIRNYIYARPAGITQTVRGAFPYFIFDQDDALFAGIDASSRWQHTKRLQSLAKASVLWARDIRNHSYFVGLPPAQLEYTLSQQLPKTDWLDESFWDVSLLYTFRQWMAPRVVPVREILEANNSDTNLFATDRSTFDFTEAPSGYLLVHLAWTGQINHFRVGLQLRNALNTRYRSYTNQLRYFADETGRNLMVSLKYVF